MNAGNTSHSAQETSARRRNQAVQLWSRRMGMSENV